MKDYSSMSDLEINKLVAVAIWDTDFSVLHGEFDPCNSWADAGPIIEKNKIDINWSMQGGNVRQPYARNSDPEAIGRVGYIHDNPLRAAMIVFLMMQESK